ncbi:uncharacterized protein [Aquarana catesbeiana]|uniref:uncharacterized protein n=1 Tax=Aquarana catesbeiana TaxID=8400 RepID=UPI003CCA5818
MLFSAGPAPSCIVLGAVMMENRREYSGLIVLTVLGALLLGTRAQQQQIVLVGHITSSVGNDVTLVPQYIREIKEIIWRINKTIMVEMELNPLVEITFDLPRNRFTINETNRALTIRNLTINDSGFYTAEVLLKNNAVHKTEITLTVIDGYEYSIPNKGNIPAGVIPSAIIIIIIAVAVLCVVYKRSQKKKEIRWRTAAMSTTAFLDEDTYEVNMAERL